MKHLVMLASLLVAQAGSAHSGPSLRQQLEDRYAAMKAAFESKNERIIRSVLADGFVSVDVDGKPQDTGQMIKFVLALPSDPSRQSKTTILLVRGDERAAVVKQRHDTSTRVKDTDGSEKSLVASAISTDNWVNANGSWRVTRSVTNEFDMTVDGKTVVHKTNLTTK